MKLDVPDRLAPQIEAILAGDQSPKQTPVPYRPSVSMSPADVDVRIRVLNASWKKLVPTQRGTYIDDILKARPELSSKKLGDLIGISGPAVGYHRRFVTLLSPADQQLLDDGVITIPEAIGRCRAQLAINLQETLEQQEAVNLTAGAEDLDCAQETAPLVIPADQIKNIHPNALRELRDMAGVPFISSDVLASSSEAPPALQNQVFPVNALYVPTSRKAADLDGAYEAFREWVGWDAQPKPCEPRPRGEFVKRIVINDLHIPFMCADSFRKMIDAEAADTDELIIAGDVATMANFSVFPKFSRTYTPVEGFVETTKIMQYLNETFPSVKVFSGNHDNRFIKWLVKDKGIPPEILEYFECLAPNFTDPLRIICKDLDNVEVIEPIQYEQANLGFLYQFGDFVVTHAETYSKIPNRAATNVSHWIKSFAEPCGIVGVNGRAGKHVRCVGQAHTHQAGKVFGDYGVWCFELGCMTQMEEYVGSPRIMTPRPWVLGYTKVIQDLAGNTDINQSNFIHTGKF